jgi:hypothetical protein
MSSAAKAVRPASTEAVIQNHLRSARIGVDALLEDYTADSVLVTHDATYRGPGQIREFFTALLASLPAGFFETMKLHRQEVVGELAYILWSREPITRATDTFVVRDGKILFQTFTAGL